MSGISSPAITLNSNVFPQGGLVTVTGSGFTASKPVYVWLQQGAGAPANIIAAPIADGSGAWSINFGLPTSAAITTWTIWAQDSTTNVNSAKTDFNVVASTSTTTTQTSSSTAQVSVTTVTQSSTTQTSTVTVGLTTTAITFTSTSSNVQVTTTVTVTQQQSPLGTYQPSWLPVEVGGLLSFIGAFGTALTRRY